MPALLPQLFSAIKQTLAKRRSTNLWRPQRITLSRYFPAGTHYFYGYPAGEDSSFYNAVPTWIEELVAARPLVCAGKHVRVISFARPAHHETRRLLEHTLGTRLAHPQNTVLLPDAITNAVTGAERNTLIKTALKSLAKTNSIVMAQPFDDPALTPFYQIDPQVVIWLNDKTNMTEYVPGKHLPQRLANYKNGAAFARSKTKVPVPCVIKLSSSSSGDGVYICLTKKDVAVAKKALRGRNGTIYIEQYIDAKHNFGIHFGIPSDPSKPVEIIGYNQQVTTDKGAFLGGVIVPDSTHPELAPVLELLQGTILPKIRAKGWHGIGGFDCLIDKNGNFYLIDCNFRMTGMSAFMFLTRSGEIKKSSISFTGVLPATNGDLKEKLVPLARAGKNQKLKIISLVKTPHDYHFNAAILFDGPSDLKKTALNLKPIGVQSTIIDTIIKQA